MEQSFSHNLTIILLIVLISGIFLYIFLNYLKSKKLMEILSKNIDLNSLLYKGIEGDITSIEIDVKDSGKGVVIKFNRKGKENTRAEN